MSSSFSLDCRRPRPSKITRSRCRNLSSIVLWSLERCRASPRGRPGYWCCWQRAGCLQIGRQLALVAATLAGACVILISFLPPFLAYKELDLTGSAIRRYAAEVERMRWWHWLLLAGHTNPVSRGMLAVAEARPRRPA